MIIFVNNKKECQLPQNSSGRAANALSAIVVLSPVSLDQRVWVEGHRVVSSDDFVDLTAAAGRIFSIQVVNLRRTAVSKIFFTGGLRPTHCCPPPSNYSFDLIQKVVVIVE